MASNKRLAFVFVVVVALLMAFSALPQQIVTVSAQEPTTEPTTEATVEPTTEATVEPTTDATVEPTTDATVEPTTDATVEPTTEATVEPTTEATVEPTVEPTTEPTGTELIVNGGFEAVTERAADLTPWTLKSPSGDKVKCNKIDPPKTFSYEGECAFAFKGSTGEASTLQQVVDLTELTFAVDETLDFSAFVKSTNAAAAGKIKVVVLYGDETESGKFTANIATNLDYTEATGSITVASADVSKIKVQFKHKSTAGKVYVDAVSLVQNDAVPAAIPLP